MNTSTTLKVVDSVCHLCYMPTYSELHVQFDNDDSLELSSVNIDTVMCFVRNALIVDIIGMTPERSNVAKLSEHNRDSLRECYEKLKKYYEPEQDSDVD